MAVDIPTKYQGDHLNHAGVRRPPSALAYTLVNPTGSGFLAGSFPDGITSVEGEPTPATVRVLFRPESGRPGDGYVVAEVQSNPDGTWLVEGLNPELKFDVVGRKNGYNDVIMANVSPYSEDFISWSGQFTPSEDGSSIVGSIKLNGGQEPYTVTPEGSYPAGIEFYVSENHILSSGVRTEGGTFEFSLRVESANGIVASVPVSVEMSSPLPTVIGEPYEGGFYIGDIEDQGQMYKVLVAPKEADVYGLQWKKANTATAGTDSPTDGWSNTGLMNSADHPAAIHCIDYRGGGHDDWYMPAKDELNLFWLNIAPSKTRVPEFQTGGEQALHGSQYYWASTQQSASFAWNQRTSDGHENYRSKNEANKRVRPVRRLPFNP